MYSLPREPLLVLVLSSDLDSLQNLSSVSKELNVFLNDKYVLKQLSIQHEVPTSDSLQQLYQLFTQSLGKRLLFAVRRKDYDSVIRMLEIQDQIISKEEYEAVLVAAKRSSYSILKLLYDNRLSIPGTVILPTYVGLDI